MQLFATINRLKLIQNFIMHLTVKDYPFLDWERTIKLLIVLIKLF